MPKSQEFQLEYQVNEMSNDFLDKTNLMIVCFYALRSTFIKTGYISADTKKKQQNFKTAISLEIYLILALHTSKCTVIVNFS
jgi:hypothetical protein